MANLAEAPEAALLDSALQYYESQGFTVYVEPSQRTLPSFLQGYRPDALAVKGDKKIIIEVKRSSAEAREQFEQLRKVISEHPGWEVQFYYSPPRTTQPNIQAVPLTAIQRTLDEVEELRRNGRYLTALLLMRSTLEALARVLLATNMERPQQLRSVIETLASEGWITPEEADALRSTILMGNAAAHGQLDVTIGEGQLDIMISVLKNLAKLASEKIGSGELMSSGSTSPSSSQ